MAFQNACTVVVNLLKWRSKHRKEDYKKRKKGHELTVVMEDYSASSPKEVSVQRGMQVEVIDASPGQLDWCLVRTLPPDGADSAQGLVPVSILKPLAFLHPGARNSIELDDSMSNEGTSSPVSKRRTSFKKWLTTPVRKLSHGKIEKQGGMLLDPQRALQRGERRTFISHLGAERDSANGDGVSEQMITPQVASVNQHSKSALDTTSEEEEPAEDIEMPPSMEIQEHSFKPDNKEVSTDDVTAKLASQLTLKSTSDTTASSLELANQIESIVKQRIEPSSDSPNANAESNCVAAHKQGSEENNIDANKDTDSEKTKNEDEDDEKKEDEEEAHDKESEKAKYIKKRQFVVQELFDTEKDYVKDLASLVDGYMKVMNEGPLPEDMEGKDKIVFGNIHQIYDWHNETMLSELEKCLTNPARVGSIFIRYERRLYMYVKYCENKPKSEFVVSEFVDTYFEEVRQKLGHRLMLPDLLIKPVQRIMRYQLLLKDILKYTEKAEEDTTELNKALRVMCIVPKAANDMMQVGRLQGFDGKLTAQGKLLLQDTLLVSEVSSGGQQKFKERRVFLFEQIIIFSEMIERKKGNFSNASYIFKNSLKVNKMSLTDRMEGEPLRFQLTDRTPGADQKMVVQANSEENKDSWIRQIKNILDMQGDFLRALQSPIAYQKELTKELSTPELSNKGPSTSDSALRKTQSHPLNRVFNTSPSKSVAQKTKSDTVFGSSKSQSERCKSLHGQFNSDVTRDDSAVLSHGKSSLPNSPMDHNKDFVRTPGNEIVRKGSSSEKFSSETASGSNSPKPRRNIFEGFKNSLGRKSKSTDERKTSDIAAAISSGLPQSLLDSANAVMTENAGRRLNSESSDDATTASACPTSPGAAAASSSTPHNSMTSRVSGRNVTS